MKNVFTAFSRPDKKQRMVNIESSGIENKSRSILSHNLIKGKVNGINMVALMEDIWQTLK